jgi:hypothetical protein
VNNGSSRASYDTDKILWKFPKPVDVSSTELHCSYFEGRARITYTFDMIEPGGVVGGPVWLAIRGLDAEMRSSGEAPATWESARGLGADGGQGAPQVALSHL